MTTQAKSLEALPLEALPLEIAIAFTQAWTGHGVPKAAEYVSEDVVFEGPLGQTTGSAAYLKGPGGSCARCHRLQNARGLRRRRSGSFDV